MTLAAHDRAVLGPYRTPASVQCAVLELSSPFPPAQMQLEADDLAPVAHEHDGEAPLDEATANRLAVGNAVGMVVLLVMMVGSILVFEWAFGR